MAEPARPYPRQPAGSREKRLLIWMARPAALRSTRTISPHLGAAAMPVAAGVRTRAASWPPALVIVVAARRQLVRRQPRRHPGASPPPRAAALRLLRRSRPGRGRHPLPDRRALRSAGSSASCRRPASWSPTTCSRSRSRWRRTRSARSGFRTGSSARRSCASCSQLERCSCSIAGSTSLGIACCCSTSARRRIAMRGLVTSIVSASEHEEALRDGAALPNATSPQMPTMQITEQS